MAERLECALTQWKKGLSLTISPVNSSRPFTDSYLCQWTMASLEQIIACHRIDGKPSSEPNMIYCQLDGPVGTMNCEPNATIFIQENDIEKIICTISSILSRPPYDSEAEWSPFAEGISIYQIPLTRSKGSLSFCFYCFRFQWSLFLWV